MEKVKNIILSFKRKIIKVISARRTRKKIPLLLKKLRLNGEGVEIGVQLGLYSYYILSVSNLKRLYSIDPWIKLPDDVYYNDNANVDQEKQEERYNATVKRLAIFKDRSVILRMKSEDAVNLFKNQQLDFVYIDALHSHEGCKKDIDFWWPKLKVGGVFAGHDYMDDKTKKRINREHYGVNYAVDQFIKENKQKLFLTKEKISKSWYVIKS